MSSAKAAIAADRRCIARVVKASLFVDESPLPFACVLAWSALLHVFAAGEMRGAPRTHVTRTETVIALLAPEPAPLPTAVPEPAPSAIAPPTPSLAPHAAPSPIARAASSPALSLAPVGDGADDVPADFTGAVLTSAVAGVALGNASAGAPVIARPAPPVARPVVRHVAVADLARLPRPPRLDDALERFYPIDARNAGAPGTAVLRVEILADGRVGDVRAVTESRAGFARACESAVRSAPWDAPADRAGVPVATFVTYTCRFEVRS